ncbi:MAG: glycogen phosphorylase, partial [Terriglobus sp.]
MPMQDQQAPRPQQQEPNQQAQDTQPNENRAGTSAKDLEISFLNHMTHTVGRPLENSSLLDQYHALAAVVRDRLMDQWLETIESYKQHNVRVLGYLSAEYLLGPHLENDLLNLDITKQMDEALKSIGLDLKTIAAVEPEPG